jgi:membrane-bound metal-dependent hydrolase YbcI (DUF457 family)
MANYKGHIVGGLVASSAFAVALYLTPIHQVAETADLLYGWQSIVAVLVIGVLFGLFPDVDTNSKAQDLFFWIVFPLDILLLAIGNIQAAAYLGLIAMLPIIGHHRGWTHSKWAMFVVPLPILIVPYLYNNDLLPVALMYYGAAVFGYFSYLLLDGQIIRRFSLKTKNYPICSLV